MYRKYRIGDLPDIQIKYSYVIAPLQALAQVRYVNVPGQLACMYINSHGNLLVYQIACMHFHQHSGIFGVDYYLSTNRQNAEVTKTFVSETEVCFDFVRTLCWLQRDSVVSRQLFGS